LPVDVARLTIRKAVVNTRMRTPEKFDSMIELEQGVADVLLAVLSADASTAILIEFMGIFSPTQVLAYLYLLDGLCPIHVDDTIGGEDGILDELHTAICAEQTRKFLQLFRGRRVAFPLYARALAAIESSRAYLLAKRRGESEAAKLMGIDVSRVTLYRKRVSSKLRGLNWSFK
jgi:hypothetical protein